ncbi:unnamed protein product [Symbiodinium natans]|uniref:Uncharacterized protein n=1 Tax=Symbiodinium natans TaxID=878477 RepID=A0A812JM77_9DINO|nr:unnamed protein product [Symbiodinium natans]
MLFLAALFPVLKEIRKNLRFGLSDRVLCNCGPLWLSGGIVGSAVESEGELFPYVVKTDPLPGLPSRTISVPGDNEHVCIQEVCFNPVSELHLIKSAAATRVTSSRPNLRFAEGDKVAVRIKNSTQDGLEQWMSGIVSTVWPRLPGERQWSFAGMSGEFPQEVPYKVDLSPGPPNFVFVHWDNHTLIRRDGLQPQDRVKGISKRLEIRTCEDGSVEQFDHLTERHKPVPRRPMVDPKDMEVSDSDSD